MIKSINDNETDSFIDSTASVSYFITGFGPFGGVTENPTSAILDCLQTEKNAHNPKLRHVHMLDTVRVAASNASQQVNRMMERIHENWVHINSSATALNSTAACTTSDCAAVAKCTSKTRHVILLHLGVNHQRRNRNGYQGRGGEIAFQLEQNAFNEANFRIPDEDGWKPRHEKITVEKDLGCKLSTDLNLKRIRDSLIQKGFDVCISGDAGRFICNYIYWESLNKIAAKSSNNGGGIPVDCKVHALFVHVPDFDCISKDVQIDFLMELVNSVSESILRQELKQRNH
jgi:pyroglutamyl-peptidase